jgi:hypothetical protein
MKNRLGSRKRERDLDSEFGGDHQRNSGKAVLNAVELKALLFGGSVSAPPQLVETYPELKDLALAPES